MSATRYLDTSVLVPMFFPEDKLNTAAEALFRNEVASGPPPVAVNVLGELFARLTSGRNRPNGRPSFDHPSALERVEDLARQLDVHAVEKAHWSEVARIKRELSRDYQIWDALHWAAAKAFKCSELLTLDAPGGYAGKTLEGVRFIDPFA